MWSVEDYDPTLDSGQLFTKSVRKTGAPFVFSTRRRAAAVEPSQPRPKPRSFLERWSRKATKEVEQKMDEDPPEEPKCFESFDVGAERRFGEWSALAWILILRRAGLSYSYM